MLHQNFFFRKENDISVNPEEYLARTQPGINDSIISAISGYKQEPAWMRRQRMEAQRLFQELELPTWGDNLSGLNFHKLTYFLRSQDRPSQSWDSVPAKLKETFARLGVPEAEQKYLAGVGAQYESEVIYHNLQKEWQKQGVIFLDTDSALREYPKLFKRYFGKLIPASDHKFAALNAAAWSGGSFVYVPAGIKLEMPLQTYFRLNAREAGQFERTIIIAEAGSDLHYVEGCTAPIYSQDSLHAGVVEVYVKRGARVRYTTIQNWSDNVYNLVTKRARVEAGGYLEWVDCNLGSKLTMKYPAAILAEPEAKTNMLSLSLAGSGQHQDSGVKVIHQAPHTTSLVTAKSVAYQGGKTTFRSLVKTNSQAKHSSSRITCESLLLDDQSSSFNYPLLENKAPGAKLDHEAKVFSLSEEQLFFLKSRGFNHNAAANYLVNGFLEPIVKEIPLEYAVEIQRLIEQELDKEEL